MSMSTKLEKDRTYVKPRLTCGPGKTKQSFAAQVNVNNIVARYHKTGMLITFVRIPVFLPMFLRLMIILVWLPNFGLPRSL